LTIYDMVVSVTRMLEEDIQLNPFRVPVAGSRDDNSKLLRNVTNHSCLLLKLLNFPASNLPTGFWDKCINNADTNLWQKSPCYKQEYDKLGKPIGEKVHSMCYHFPQVRRITLSKLRLNYHDFYILSYSWIRNQRLSNLALV